MTGPTAAGGATPVRSEPLPYHRSWFGPEEEEAVLRVLRGGRLIGNGPETEAFERELATLLGLPHVLFTTSCTSALQLALLSLPLEAGEEVICPSFGYVSMANAVLLAGGRPVFADIEEETLGLDPASVEAAITPRTRAILPVHYAGIPCRIAELRDLAARRGCLLVEDAAQGIGATQHGRPLGTWGDAGLFSFHDTKNVVTGEGGAMATADADWAARAEIAFEKGTNRMAFVRGEVDRYTWIDRGSSFVQSDLLAAIGRVQLGKLDRITARRRELAARLLHGLRDLPEAVRLPTLPEGAEPNWHIFAVRVPPARRDDFLAGLKREGIGACTHYVPLHGAPFARERLGTRAGDLPVTERVADSLVRLPLYPSMSDRDADDVAEAVRRTAASLRL